MSWAGMPSVMATQRRMPASAASMMESAAKGGGTNTMLAVAPVSRDGVAHRVEHGQAEMGRAALAGGHAADDLGAVGQHLLGVEAADLAGDALDDDAGVSSRRTLMMRPSGGCGGLAALPGGDHLVGGVGEAVGGDDGEAAGFEDAAALLHMRAGEAHHQRHLHLDLLQRLHDALGDPVAAVDAGEDVDQDGLDLLVREHEVEGLGDALGRGAAADVEEVRGLAAGMLDHVHGGHGQAGAVDDAADVAVEADIAEAAVGRAVSRGSSWDLSRSSEMCGRRKSALSSKLILASRASS